MEPCTPLPTTGPFRSGIALDEGWTYGELDRRLRDRTLNRLRHGVLMSASEYRALPDHERHRLHVQAHQLAFDHETVASHGSAATLHGLPVLWKLTRVELTSTTARRRNREELLLRRAPIPPTHVQVVADGVRVTSVARTVVDCARTQSFRHALVLADAALYRRLVTHEELDAVLADLRGWRGAPAAARVVRHACSLAESPGETLTRADLLALGYAAAVPQFEVRGHSGKRYRADLALPELRVLIEFDGDVKYTDREILRAEKRREDDLRLAGWGIVRVVWAELGDTDRLRAKIAAAAAQSSGATM